MTKCSPGNCVVGIYKEYKHLPCEKIMEADLKREGDDVLEDVEKFDYCPSCGHKINWKRIAKELGDYFKKLEVKNGKKKRNLENRV
jgi:hypothetical protein